jgi:DMSO/TMAO reductase YedYZ heme-binding membrane subunit
MLFAEVNSKLSWYIARSGGLVAWAVCTASIVWGLTLSTRLVRRKGAPAWLLDLHRFLGTLSIVFTAVHLFGLYIDKFLPYSLKDLFIPYHKKYKVGYVAWGIVAFYLLLAIQLTSWSMRKMPRKVWHTIHLSSFLLFAFSTVHAFGVGADHKNRLVIFGCFTGGSFVLFLLLFRLLAPRKSRKRPAARESVPV